jgi:predicted DNA-binding transcriptional regulator AlpA
MTRTILRLEEVAERTGIPLATLRWWRTTGNGGPPTFKLGRRVMVDEADLNAWLDEQREATGLAGTHADRNR